MDNDLASWLDACAPGSRDSRPHQHFGEVHTLALTSQLLINVFQEAGARARITIFSSPGCMSHEDRRPEGHAQSPGLIDDDGSRWDLSIDPHDGTVLVRCSFDAEPLDETSLRARLMRFVATHLAWVVLLAAQPVNRILSHTHNPTSEPDFLATTRWA